MWLGPRPSILVIPIEQNDNSAIICRIVWQSSVFDKEPDLRTIGIGTGESEDHGVALRVRIAVTGMWDKALVGIDPKVVVERRDALLRGSSMTTRQPRSKHFSTSCGNTAASRSGAASGRKKSRRRCSRS